MTASLTTPGLVGGVFSFMPCHITCHIKNATITTFRSN